MHASIERADKAVKTQEKLAVALGLKSRGQISQWVKSRRPVPSKWCIQIERVTGGVVTRYELRPDVFGHGPDGVVQKAG